LILSDESAISFSDVLFSLLEQENTSMANPMKRAIAEIIFFIVASVET
jgi:hypothetical protein